MTYRLQTILKDDFDNFAQFKVLKESLERFSEMRLSDDETHMKVRFSSHKNLDFVIRRNLEHILSVCSMPVLFKEDGDLLVKDKNPTIALTCRDMAGHRVWQLASL